MRFQTKKNYSIRHILLACFISILLFSCILMFIYFYGFLMATKNQLHDSLSLYSDEKEKQFTDNFESIERAAKMVGYSVPIQTYLLSEDSSARIRNSSLTHSVFTYALDINPSIVDIYVFSDNNTHAYATAFRRDFIERAIEQSNLQFGNELREGFLSKIMYQENDPTPYCIYFYPVYNILPFSSDTVKHIVCAVMFDMNSIISVSDSSEENGLAAVIYNDQIISSNFSYDRAEASAILTLSDANGQLKLNGRTYFSNVLQVSDINCKFVYLVTSEKLVGNLITKRNTLFIILLMGTLFITFVMLMTVKNMSNSFNQVIEDIEVFNSKTLDFRIRIQKTKELKEVTTTINQMLDRIEKSTKKEQETQRNLFEALLAQNRAEMLAYRSQINPHFLFNTLECMRSMAQYYNAPPLADLITSMSSMFRYSLNSGVTSLLEAEVNHLANYVNIMSARFSQRFLLKVLMEENTKYARCLSMILQPLAENAIIHAFTGYNNDVPCCLCVQTKMDKENQQLVIRLTDNGRGMVPEEVEALNMMMRQPEDDLQAHKDSIGLPNIFKRLKLAYGNHCHLRICSKLNYYTSITIIIPQEALHNFPEC